jgi:hypothetical protein
MAKQKYNTGLSIFQGLFLHDSIENLNWKELLEWGHALNTPEKIYQNSAPEPRYKQFINLREDAESSRFYTTVCSWQNDTEAA